MKSSIEMSNNDAWTIYGKQSEASLISNNIKETILSVKWWHPFGNCFLENDLLWKNNYYLEETLWIAEIVVI